MWSSLSSSLSLAAYSRLRSKRGEPLPVYCVDEPDEEMPATTYFCRELEARGQDKASLELVEREEAEVEVELVGVNAYATAGMATVLLSEEEWTPQQKRVRAEAAVKIGKWRKSFTGEGDLYDAIDEVVGAVEVRLR